jgi:hypothetical protein
MYQAIQQNYQFMVIISMLITFNLIVGVRFTFELLYYFNNWMDENMK